MLNKDIIQRIQSLYSKGVQSDDKRLSSRHIFNKLQSMRNRLLYEKSNKNQFLSQTNYQVLPCVELELVPIHECPCIPCKGCQVYRTKYPLPQPVSGISKHLIRSVTTLDGKGIYNETSWENAKYQAYQKYTSSDPNFYITNGYLYITSKNEAEVIRIELLAEDITKVYSYPSYCPTETSCESYLDKEFPLDGSMIDTLIEMSVQELLAVFNQGREDSSNNSKDNTEQETK